MGYKHSGDCPEKACEWYTQWTTIPATAATTNCDPQMRTMGVNCGDTSPTDYPCSSGIAVSNFLSYARFVHRSRACTHTQMMHTHARNATHARAHAGTLVRSRHGAGERTVWGLCGRVRCWLGRSEHAGLGRHPYGDLDCRRDSRSVVVNYCKPRRYRQTRC